jgi:2-keto-4-pentenoate hydratase/2-oxohepta-3-ene-1,7-dioic acid hydratase in catechol pathway
MQDAGTDQLIFSASALIEMISVAMSLEPGDVIITGTPGGIGAPPWPQPGVLTLRDPSRPSAVANLYGQSRWRMPIAGQPTTYRRVR